MVYHQEDNKSSLKSPYWITFRKCLKAILKQRGMSQKALADAIGSKPSAVSAWLSDASKSKSAQKYPNAEHLFSIADALAVSLDKVVGRKVPGTEVLERARDESRRKADALDQVLAGGVGKPAKKAANRKRKTKKKGG